MSSTALEFVEKDFMIKNKNVAFGLFVVLFMILWNVCDLLWSMFITHGLYTFAAGIDLGLPIVVALVSGYLLFLRKQSK